MLALAAGVLACASEPASSPVEAGPSGSTLVRDDARGLLWVTSPDDAAVVALDMESLEEVRRVTVAGAPEQLALVGSRLVVTALRSVEVTFVDPDGAAPPVPVIVPCGGTRGLATWREGQRERALVTCPYDDRVVVLDVEEARVLADHAAPGRPTAAAAVGDEIVVSASREQILRRAPPGELTSAGSIAWEPLPLPTDAPRRGLRLDDLTSAGGALAGLYMRMDTEDDRDHPPDDGGYGRVVDGAPRIEPWLLAPCGGRLARFDGAERVLSGPSALAWDVERGLLWVVFRATGNVGVFRCEAEHGEDPVAAALAGAEPLDEVPLVATFRVGDGARGIALSDDGRRAWVDVGFDHAVSLLELDLEAAGEGPVGYALAPSETVRRDASGVSLSPTARRGRRDFHDARNTHLTPSGIVTCATCHPGGGDDGLRWFLHTNGVPRKLRQTPPTWNVDALPLHWDGEFASPEALVRATIRELLGGDGLVVDASAMVAWMASVEPPTAPPLDAAGREAAERGEALFLSEEVGCATCHPGGGTDGQLHAVIPPADDPDAALAEVLTPSLRGIRARAPYLHDGRAPDLEAILTTWNPGDAHGRTGGLAPEELADLLRYLETL